jgi:hypothetical protein
MNSATHVDAVVIIVHKKACKRSTRSHVPATYLSTGGGRKGYFNASISPTHSSKLGSSPVTGKNTNRQYETFSLIKSTKTRKETRVRQLALDNLQHECDHTSRLARCDILECLLRISPIPRRDTILNRPSSTLRHPRKDGGDIQVHHDCFYMSSSPLEPKDGDIQVLYVLWFNGLGVEVAGRGKTPPQR